MPKLVVAAGRERSLSLRHPWVYSGAIASIEGDPSPGETVLLVDHVGQPLALGAYSPQSQIRVRVWSFRDETIDGRFIAARVAASVARRAALRPITTAMRLVNAESDGLPGVIVDRYADVLVVQLLSAGAERWRDAIVAALVAAERPLAVYERSDAEVRALEGLPSRAGLIEGSLPSAIVVEEHGLRYAVDVALGQKTGFYLDQRDNRRLLGERCAGHEVLNAFCYTGGFSIPALRAGAARVLSLDSSAEALEMADCNAALNAVRGERAQWRQADVFSELRRLRNDRASFDAVILDPPKFAPTAQHVQRAARAYKDINLLALKLLRPGGWLATFSCSGGVGAELFRKIVAGAAVDAGVDARVVARLGAAEDHPVALNFPEGEYLKGLLIATG